MSDSDSDTSTEYNYRGLDMQNLDTAISSSWTPPPVKSLAGIVPLAIPLDEDIDPNALFTENKQIWDKRTVGNWITRPSKPQWTQTPGSGRLIFQAYERTYGPFGPSSDDHTWIVLRSKPLLELLRSEEIMKGLDGMDYDPPGLDARHIFLRLDKLRERVVELEAEAARGEGETPAAPVKPVELSIPQHQASPAPQAFHIRPPATQRSWFSSLTSLIPHFGAAQHPPIDILQNTLPKEPTSPPLSVPQQLSELLNFVENHYADTREQLKRLEVDEHMPYHLLWTMCTPGSIIEGRDEATEKPTGVRVESWDYGARGEVFSLYGTAYCWDGKMFKSSTGTVEIARYKGVVKIKQLPIQPLSSEVRTRLIERGQLYKKFAGVLHLRYNSFIYVYNRKHKTYYKLQAHGRVMLDTAGFDRFGSNSTNRYLMDDYTYPSLHATAKKPTGFPEQFDINFDFPDDVLCLMPPAHLGYSFSAKLWGRISVDALSEIVFSEHAFDRLVLSDEYKDIIKAQVETFSKKSDELVSDLVENKGGGMVMVLHGKPGESYDTLTLWGDLIEPYIRYRKDVDGRSHFGAPQVPTLHGFFGRIRAIRRFPRASVARYNDDVRILECNRSHRRGGRVP
ncbi:hypothetical protein FRC08_007162 [Ceratobasidium sp. 394]|nr:hypothetical protein FRC08_007162 [Ceratobasidium sp. 394]